MAFPDGWRRCCPVTIDHTKVPADLVNFPIVLTKNTLPSDLFDADGSYPALSGGADIRASLDRFGRTQLPVEIVALTINNNPALGTAEIWVKITSLSSSVDTTIYIWYNNAGASMPARNSTYGSDNVWDANFKFVAHQGASIGDSTSAAVAGTNHGTTDDATTTLIGISARKYVSASSQYIDYGNIVNINGDVDITVESVHNHNSLADTVWQWYIGRGDPYNLKKRDKAGAPYNQGHALGLYDTGFVDTYATDTPTLTGTWYHFSGRRTASSNLDEIFVNGVKDLVHTSTTTTIANVAASLFTGASAGPDKFMDGWLEEERISDTARSDAWITATYNTINSPATFASAGTSFSPAFSFIPFFAAQDTRGNHLVLGVQ